MPEEHEQVEESPMVGMGSPKETYYHSFGWDVDSTMTPQGPLVVLRIITPFEVLTFPFRPDKAESCGRKMQGSDIAIAKVLPAGPLGRQG